MEPVSQLSDPFDIDKLLCIPDLHDTSLPQWLASATLEPELLSLAEAKTEPLLPLVSHQFVLDLEDVSLPDFETSPASATPSEGDSSSQEARSDKREQEQLEDLWILPDARTRSPRTGLLCWENSMSYDHANVRSAYLVEAGPEAFDIIWHRTTHSNDETPLKPVKPNLFLSSLFDLGMGRQSPFFGLNAQQELTALHTEPYSLPGFTVPSTLDVVAVLRDCGTKWRDLQQFVNHAVSKVCSKHIVAFASSLTSVFHALSVHLERKRAYTRSVLQLRDLFDQTNAIVDTLKALKTVVDQPLTSNTANILLVFQDQALCNPELAPMMEEILKRMTIPLLERVAICVGLRHLQYAANSDRELDSEFLGPELQQLLQKCNQSYDLLSLDQPGHPLLTMTIDATEMNDSSLSLDFSWEGVGRLHARAQAYEERQRSILQTPNTARPSQQLHSLQRTSPSYNEPFDIAMPWKILPPQNVGRDVLISDHEVGSEDRLTSTTLSYLENTGHKDMVPKPHIVDVFLLSIRPLLTAQHRLLSYSIVESLFQRHSLVRQLHLLHDYSLVGNGVFATRLGEALFDPAQASGEKQRTTGGVIGMRLQYRDAWPPASSELRLALMGILSESMASRVQDTAMGLSDSLSFAIRDLPDDELERCRDIDSIYALDFLRLQYRSPTSLLEPIITPESLYKYDRIFRHLLRLMRIQSTAQNLLRDLTYRNQVYDRKDKSRKLRIEMQHFTSTVITHTMTVAIAPHWCSFDSSLSKIAQCLALRKYEETNLLVGSLDHLRQLHENTLDQIMRALFLKARYAKTLSVMEDGFGVILRFAALVRKDTFDDGTIQRLHEDFRCTIRTFIQQLRAQAASEGTNSPSEYLLLQLDLFGYWSPV